MSFPKGQIAALAAEMDKNVSLEGGFSHRDADLSG